MRENSDIRRFILTQQTDGIINSEKRKAMTIPEAVVAFWARVPSTATATQRKEMIAVLPSRRSKPYTKSKPKRRRPKIPANS
jgi:hypothetical protein